MATDGEEQRNNATVPLASVRALQHLGEAFHAAIRRIMHFSPRFVPLLICVCVIPLLMLFSLAAGWTVWMSVPKGWNVPVHLYYGDGGAPYTDLNLSSLSAHQPYDVSLHIVVPASETNYALGNFMVSFTLTDYWNSTMLDIRKPSLVLPPSQSIIPFVTRTPRLIELNIPLVSSAVIGSSRVKAHLELGRKDGWRSLGKGEGRELSVHSAFLRGDVRPRGIRWILSTSPLSLAIASSITFFIVSTLVLMGCLLPLIWQYPSEGDKSQGLQESPSPAAGAVKRKPSDDDIVKEDASIHLSPESEMRRRSLRRFSLSHAEA